MLSLESPWLLLPNRNGYPFSGRLGKPSAGLLVNNLLDTNMVRRFASHTCLPVDQLVVEIPSLPHEHLPPPDVNGGGNDSNWLETADANSW